MADTNPQDELPVGIDEAISWHLRVSADDVPDAVWSAFTAWLEADPANRAAFDRIEDFDATLDLARRSSEAVDIETVGLAAFRPRPERGLRARSVRVWAGAAGGLLAASLIVALFVRPFPARAVEYATRIGETKTAMLSDGSRIDINTNSRLLVRVDASGRNVTLERGEALFHVAKDAKHPFVVSAGDRAVRVTGTIFDVLSSNGAITVVVSEGRVMVSPVGDGSERDAVALLPGDQLIHDEARDRTTLARINPADALAWREGYLIYRNAPLSKVVGDLNRYFPVPVALAGEPASAMRFSGVLRLDGESAVLRHISQFLPVTVGQGPAGTIVLHASAARP